MFEPGTKFKVVFAYGMSGWSRAKKADHVFEVGHVTVSDGKIYLYPKLTAEEAESFFCGTTDVSINIEGVEIVKEDKRHKHADVIIAWANGETIQIQTINGDWQDCINNHPSWGEAQNYRVKPKTKIVWYNLYRDGPGRDYYSAEVNAKYHGVGLNTYVTTLSAEIPV